MFLLLPSLGVFTEIGQTKGEGIYHKTYIIRNAERSSSRNKKAKYTKLSNINILNIPTSDSLEGTSCIHHHTISIMVSGSVIAF